MEPQDGREPTQDQLQSPSLQDQRLQPVSPVADARRSADEPYNHSLTADADRDREPFRIILSDRNRRIRGFIERKHWRRMKGNPTASPLSWFRPLESADGGKGEQERFTTDNVKALFVVRSFEGEREHDTIFFHDDVTPPEWLWVKVSFTDGEVLEGMIDNDAAFVLNPGFVLYPTDPTGNNLMVYVFKAEVQHCSVLGLRQRFRRAGTRLGEENSATHPDAAD